MLTKHIRGVAGRGSRQSFSKLAGRGDLARDGRNWAQAVAAYAEALEVDASKAALWVQHGHALKELGYLANSEVSYRRALSLEPATSDTHQQLGHVLKLQGRIREAAESYFTAWRTDPTLDAAKQELMQFGFTAEAVVGALKTGVLPGRPYLEDRPAKIWNTVAEGLQRLRIERGWLYRTCVIVDGSNVNCAMTFVPD